MKAIPPIVSTLAGTGIMAWNAASSLVKPHDPSKFGIGTAQFNFMGIQDMFIGGALFVGFAALARATYLYSQGNKADSKKYFALAGGMFLAAGLYALTVGIFQNPVHGSQIGNFKDMSQSNSSMFGLVYSALVVMGAALVGTGYKVASTRPLVHQLGGTASSANIQHPFDNPASTHGGIPHNHESSQQGGGSPSKMKQ